MILLGIDGGGSKTAFLLEDDAGSQLARLEAGPSNWLSVGESESRKSIAAGLSQLPAVPDIVCGGFAGAGRPEGLEFYRDCLSSLLPNVRILIETDAFVAYVGALGLESGVLLIVGTGSIVIARQRNGAMIRVGGWGPVFGDEGSGHWIGREAIRTALRANDAGEFPDFVALINQALNLKTITDVVVAWKTGKVDAHSVATLAKLMVQQYPAEPANRILSDAAAQLRSLTETAVRRAGIEVSCRKAIAGSLGSQPLMQQLIGMEFATPENPPERGALLWARSHVPSLQRRGGPKGQGGQA